MGALWLGSLLIPSPENIQQLGMGNIAAILQFAGSIPKRIGSLLFH
jgi:hypothetical protein